MFTGLIEKIGKITQKNIRGNMLEIGISLDTLWPDIVLGESIAVNGVCLTVTRVSKNTFFADVSMPTAQVTTLAELAKGRIVNLERALKLGDRVGGHMVQGHVDGKGIISKMHKENDNLFLQIKAPLSIISRLIAKGSVALDGISLTIQELHHDSFTVVIIPHSRENTHIPFLQVNDNINIEIDMIAKYVERCVERQKPPLTTDYLKEQGF